MFVGAEVKAENVLYTKPEVFVPRIVLTNVTCSYSDVTRVEMKLSDNSEMVIKFHNLGNGTWEAFLSQDELKEIKNDAKGKTVETSLFVKSKDFKNHSLTTATTINVNIN
jgi:hypothetical protein